MSLRWSSLFFVGALAACAVPVSEAPPVPVEVPARTPEPEPPYDEDALYALLDAAQDALDDDRLLTPEDHCAYLYFEQALAMAPDNRLAQEGFERIVERYLALATGAIERERWMAARNMLDRAGTVDPRHPGIASLRRQVGLLENARRDILTLAQTDVRGRKAAVRSQLAALGRKARHPDARVTIRAGSDADGRWIYQQLNEAPGERRIRASLQIGVPPKVTVLFLGGTE